MLPRIFKEYKRPEWCNAGLFVITYIIEDKGGGKL